jgi:hypothetical protein
MRIMRTYNIVIMILLSSLAVSSCEEILDADGLPYEEKLVIHGIIMADSGFVSVDISRTLPLNIPFDTAQAFIKDAHATISDGTTTYDLKHSSSLSGYYASGWAPREGATYTLDVDWHGLHTHASTTIPQGGSIDTCWVETVETPWGGVIRQLVAVAHLPEGCSMQLESFANLTDTNSFPSWSHGDQVFRSKDPQGPTTARLNLSLDVSDSIRDLTAIVRIFAPGYYEYRQSRETDIDANLGNPVLVRWNVTGDGIGVFFGCKRINYTVIK